jgi:hippurate hydrolase
MQESNYLAHSLVPRIGDFIQIRRDIHARPELAFEEHQRSSLVSDKLKSWGYEVTTGLGGTGVVGTLRRGQKGKSIGLRADMDALPILEVGSSPWKSQTSGVMHACGHDGHTAMLLAAAKLIAEDLEFDGAVHLIFQQHFGNCQCVLFQHNCQFVAQYYQTSTILNQQSLMI